MDWSGGGGLNWITKHTWLRVNLAEWSNKLNPLCENSKDYPCVAFLPPPPQCFWEHIFNFCLTSFRSKIRCLYWSGGGHVLIRWKYLCEVRLDFQHLRRTWAYDPVCDSTTQNSVCQCVCLCLHGWDLSSLRNKSVECHWSHKCDSCLLRPVWLIPVLRCSKLEDFHVRFIVCVCLIRRHLWN